MGESRSPEEEPKALWRASVRSAVFAGVIYACLLLAAAMLCGAASRHWLAPLVGEGAAFAAELTIMLPLTWQLSGFVGRRFGMTLLWPMGAVAAGITVLLVSSVDLGFLALLDPALGRDVLNHGWVEARFVAQMLMAAFPLACQFR